MYHEQRHILGGEDRLTNSYPEAIHMGNKGKSNYCAPVTLEKGTFSNFSSSY